MEAGLFILVIYDPYWETNYDEPRSHMGY